MSVSEEKKCINIFDPRQNKLIEEKIYGKNAMLCLYGNPAGLWFTTKISFHKSLSMLSGMLNNSSFSKLQINNFIKNYNINTQECEKDLKSFTSFNDFFSRKLKANARSFPQNQVLATSPSDGRLLVFPQINKKTVSYVKWAPINLLDLFDNDPKLAQDFEDGSCAVLRLCPVDYHRFHFPVSGTPTETKLIPGHLQSVHPFALEKKLPVFCTNKRTLCVVDSPDYGKVAIIEVGALMVGSIVQTYEPNKPTERGQEKGYFIFGGSTCICFFQKNRIAFEDALINYSQKNIETLVKLGDIIGKPC